jgi:hypothetical protein
MEKDLNIGSKIQNRIHQNQTTLFNDKVIPKQNDIFYTSDELAIQLIEFTKKSLRELGRRPENLTWLDSAKGDGSFYYNYFVPLKDYNEIAEKKDFFKRYEKVDIICTNPPYSILTDYLEHSFRISRLAVGYLVLAHHLTPSRLKLAEKYGFGLHKIYMTKVRNWFGQSLFLLFVKNQKSIIDYDSINHNQKPVILY